MFNKKQGAQTPCDKYFKIMKRGTNYTKTQITREATEASESIEEMLRRLSANKEPIPANVPPIYTPAEEGVLGDYDIRHDRFDTAIIASDKFAASKAAKGANKGEGGEGEGGEGGEGDKSKEKGGE